MRLRVEHRAVGRAWWVALPRASRWARGTEAKLLSRVPLGETTDEATVPSRPARDRVVPARAPFNCKHPAVHPLPDRERERRRISSSTAWTSASSRPPPGLPSLLRLTACQYPPCLKGGQCSTRSAGSHSQPASSSSSCRSVSSPPPRSPSSTRRRLTSCLRPSLPAASGLLYVAEVIEEHSGLAKSVGKRLVYVRRPFPLSRARLSLSPS